MWLVGIYIQWGLRLHPTEILSLAIKILPRENHRRHLLSLCRKGSNIWYSILLESKATGFFNVTKMSELHGNRCQNEVRLKITIISSWNSRNIFQMVQYQWNRNEFQSFWNTTKFVLTWSLNSMPLPSCQNESLISSVSLKFNPSHFSWHCFVTLL